MPGLHRLAWAVALLLAAFGIFTFGTASADLDLREGFTMYAARDVASLDAAPRDAARAWLANVREMISRARENPPALPYYAALDSWLTLAGAHIFPARLFSVGCALLALALLLRTVKVVSPVNAVLFLLAAFGVGFAARRADVLAPLLLLTLFLWRPRLPQTTLYAIVLLISAAAFFSTETVPDWREGIRLVNDQRESTSPAITAYDPRHPLAYYDTQVNTRLRQGISVDVGWKAFSVDEIRAIVETVRRAPSVWLIAPTDQLTLPLDALTATHALTYQQEVGGVAFYRLDQRPSTQ